MGKEEGKRTGKGAKLFGRAIRQKITLNPKTNWVQRHAGRSDVTWTHGLLVPNQARYQLRHTPKWQRWCLQPLNYIIFLFCCQGVLSFAGELFFFVKSGCLSRRRCLRGGIFCARIRENACARPHWENQALIQWGCFCRQHFIRLQSVRGSGNKRSNDIGKNRF